MEEIDKINKCKYNVNGSCKLEILTPCGLVPIKDCYYKQLLRKEKECEELKKENKALRAYRDVMEQADFKGSFDKMCIENRKLIEKLEEIKVVASKVCVSRCGCVCNHKEEILQIIEGKENE